MDEGRVGPDQPGDGVDVAIADRDEQPDRVAEPIGTRGAGSRERVCGHGEHLLQSAAGRERALLRGGHGDVEERGDLGIAEIAQVVQGDDRPFGFG